MSSKIPITAAEEEAIIKARFLTGACVTRGEPPFRKLIKRFVELVDRVDNSTPDVADEALKAFLRETTNIELQAAKYQAICNAQKKEQEIYVGKQQQLQEEIEKAKRDIEDKKQELQLARTVRQHMEEYEVLRGMVSELPTRANTQTEIDKVKKHMERIEAEGMKHAAVVERRRKQYALLFHVLEELQRVNEDAETSHEPGAAPDGTDGTGQQMELDG